MKMADFFKTITDKIKAVLLADAWIVANCPTITDFDDTAPVIKFPNIRIAISDDAPELRTAGSWCHDLSLFIIPQVKHYNRSVALKGSTDIPTGLTLLTDKVRICMSARTKLDLDDTVLESKIVHIYFDRDQVMNLKGDNLFFIFSVMEYSVKARELITS